MKRARRATRGKTARTIFTSIAISKPGVAPDRSERSGTAEQRKPLKV
jgi:hypothetical protein